jgi:hypothetical protein
MSGSDQNKVHRTVERVARESYGRLVAYLSTHTHDLASAEDALSDALVAAFTRWPQDGTPQNPEAWLMTTARHSLVEAVRHHRVMVAAEPTFVLLRKDSLEAMMATAFPDERLKLLFVCAWTAYAMWALPCARAPTPSSSRRRPFIFRFDGIPAIKSGLSDSPAIDPALHTPLMLQTVLGLDAAGLCQQHGAARIPMGPTRSAKPPSARREMRDVQVRRRPRRQLRSLPRHRS